MLISIILRFQEEFSVGLMNQVLENEEGSRCFSFLKRKMACFLVYMFIFTTICFIALLIMNVMEETTLISFTELLETIIYNKTNILSS